MAIIPLKLTIVYLSGRLEEITIKHFSLSNIGEFMNNQKEPYVGDVIRSLRAEQNLSLRDLSGLSGLSVNAISKIERGENSPTVASLHQLASALEVHITDLFRQEIHEVCVFVKANQTTKLRSEGLVIESLGSGLPNQQLEPFKIIIETHMDEISDSVSHSGEEFIYCLKGKLEYFVGDKSFILEPGDRLLFKASQPHSWCNLGPGSAEVIIVLETDRQQPLPHKFH
jgi:transcriptional regulator with XRE-family HTH domain